MRLLYSILFLMSYIANAQCVGSASITSANYSQSLTQSNTYITISSSVNPSTLVRLDANPTSGYVLMNPGFVAIPNGNNAFIAQTLDGCGSLIPAKMTTDNTKEEIEEINLEIEIKIYPNPTSAFLNLFSNSILLNYKICSLDGKDILSKTRLNNKNETINVSNLSAGFYIIYIETETNEILNYKFIKE